MSYRTQRANQYPMSIQVTEIVTFLTFKWCGVINRQFLNQVKRRDLEKIEEVFTSCCFIITMKYSSTNKKRKDEWICGLSGRKELFHEECKESPSVNILRAKINTQIHTVSYYPFFVALDSCKPWKIDIVTTFDSHSAPCI